VHEYDDDGNDLGIAQFAILTDFEKRALDGNGFEPENPPDEVDTKKQETTEQARARYKEGARDEQVRI
jgi:hypothetical protein